MIGWVSAMREGVVQTCTRNENGWPIKELECYFPFNTIIQLGAVFAHSAWLWNGE